MLLLVLLATPTVQAADRPAADPLAVPKGGPEDQVAFIEALKKLKPTDPEMQAKVRDAALKSAERILAAKPNSVQLLFAVQTKAAILKDPQELTAFEEKLKKTTHKAEARIVHLRLLVVQLESAGSEALFGQHLDELKKFLGAGPLKP
jgi:hypothetical protein